MRAPQAMMETWNEADSDFFLRYGRVFTPRWESLRAMFLRLIPPAGDGESITCVDIGAGSGWLSEAILHHIQGARVIALDGSPAMLSALAERLAQQHDRIETRRFELRDFSWIDALPDDIHCMVSSLALHHLDDMQKQALYRRLFKKLKPAGALLIADLAQALHDIERLAFAEAWDDAVRQQSLNTFGDLRAYDAFCAERWNHYRYPDPVDQPARLPDMLDWLRQTGFGGVDVFWANAGHVLTGGFKL